MCVVKMLSLRRVWRVQPQVQFLFRYLVRTIMRDVSWGGAREEAILDTDVHFHPSYLLPGSSLAGFAHYQQGGRGMQWALPCG